MYRKIISVTRIRFVFLLTALALAALNIGPTNATPDRVISIDDVPVGHTDSHLYMLRTVSDNMASYYSAIQHVFLVKQHMQTGQVERHWPLRVLQYDQRFEWPEDGTTPPSRIITETDSIEQSESSQTDDMLPTRPINPFDVMRQEKVLPLSALSLFEATDNQISWKVSAADGLVKVENLTNDDTSKTTTVYSAQELKARVTTALLHTTGKLKEVSSATDTNAGSDGLSTVDPVFETCGITKWLSVSSEFHDTSQQRNFVAIICDEDSEVGRWLTWVYVGDEG